MRRLFQIALLLLPLFALCDVAYAQTAAPVDTIGAIKGAIDAMNSAASGIAGSLLRYGNNLMLSLAVIATSWFALQVILEDGNFMSVLSSFLRMIMLFGAVKLILSDYTAFGSQYSVPGLMMDTAEAIRGAVGGNSNILNGLDSFMKVASAVWDKIIASPVANWYQIFAKIDVIMMGVGTLFVLLIAALLYMGAYMMSQFMIAVAICVGPLFIPWMLLPLTAGFAAGWFRFFLTAMANSVVGAILLAITMPVLTKMVDFVNANMKDDGSALQMVGIAGAMFILAGMVAYMMSQISDVASGLFSGNGAHGFNATKAFGGMARAGSAVGNTFSKTTHAAGDGIKGGAGIATGAVNKMATGAGALAGARQHLQSGGSVGSLARAGATSAMARAKSAMGGGPVGTARSNFNEARSKVANVGKSKST